MTSFQERAPLYQAIEELRGSRVITYVTGDRPGLGSLIANDAADPFVETLDEIFPANATKKISLLLYTLGGSVHAARYLANLLRMFCDELEVIVFGRCYSAGTLMCLAADRIIMTKQALLGPIDPSISPPLAPRQQTPHGPGDPVPVSVEAINSYLSYATRHLRIRSERERAALYRTLSSAIHPLVLGDVFRQIGQIRVIADKLLSRQVRADRKRRKIVEFLVSDSGSHDYTINRREALELGLNVEKPDDKLYRVIQGIHRSLKHEMKLGTLFDREFLMQHATKEGRAEETVMIALIESLPANSHVWLQHWVFERTQIGVESRVMQTVRSYGWQKRQFACPEKEKGS